MKVDMTATLTSALQGLQVRVNNARAAAGEMVNVEDDTLGRFVDETA